MGVCNIIVEDMMCSGGTFSGGVCLVQSDEVHMRSVIIGWSSKGVVIAVVYSVNFEPWD